jgi:hypothetical protein
MRDCVILINDRLVSLSQTTHSSSLNTQLLLSLVHPSVSESWSEWLGLSGLLKKSFLFTESQVLATEQFIVLVHDIFDRGFVRKLVDHYRNHVSEGVWVKINF